MNTLINNYFHDTYSPIVAQLMLSIADSFENIYTDYDASLLEMIILDEDAESAQQADEVTTVIRHDAINVLLVHGIVLVETVSLQTLDMLLQFIYKVDALVDSEDALSLLQGSDKIFAVASLAYDLATPPEILEQYNVETCLIEIERIEPFLVNHLVDLITDNKDTSPYLTAVVTKYMTAYPESMISQLLTPPSSIFIGGSPDLYNRLFHDVLQAASIPDFIVLVTGIILISNLSSLDEYSDAIDTITSLYYEPDVGLSISMKITTAVDGLITSA